MKNYDFICNNHSLPYIFERSYHEVGDPSPSHPPNCDVCDQPTSWYPSCQWKLNEEWGVGKMVPGYGFFDSKERFDKHLAQTGKLYYEPGMERDAARTRQYNEEKIDKQIEEKIGQVVQERVII